MADVFSEIERAAPAICNSCLGPQYFRPTRTPPAVFDKAHEFKKKMRMLRQKSTLAIINPFQCGVIPARLLTDTRPIPCAD
jgi:hypothetical protein